MGERIGVSDEEWALIGPLLPLKRGRGCRPADATRAEIAIAGTQAMIPARQGRRAPALHDRQKYRLRNQIARLFNRLKTWRRIAIRYDKIKSSYLGFVSLASALLWLPFVHDAQGPLLGNGCAPVNDWR